MTKQDENNIYLSIGDHPKYAQYSKKWKKVLKHTPNEATFVSFNVNFEVTLQKMLLFVPYVFKDWQK